MFSFSPTPQLLLQHPYLLFDLLQRRLLNGTLHLLLLDGLHHLPRKKRPLVSRREGQSQITGLFVSSVLTGNFRGPYLASCRAEGDLKGVGVQGDDSMMERRMFGVLNLAEENWRLVKLSTNASQWIRWGTGPLTCHLSEIWGHGRSGAWTPPARPSVNFLQSVLSSLTGWETEKQKAKSVKQQKLRRCLPQLWTWQIMEDQNQRDGGRKEGRTDWGLQQTLRDSNDTLML